jgi:nondiscriminating glutamyl-tRNA synthetase
MPIRAALTGKVHGPELDKVFVILGKDTALKRLEDV